MALQTRLYLRKVYSALPCKRKEKRILLQSLQDSLKEYVTEMSAHCTFQDMVWYFGTPEAAANGLMNSREQET